MELKELENILLNKKWQEFATVKIWKEVLQEKPKTNNFLRALGIRHVIECHN